MLMLLYSIHPSIHFILFSFPCHWGSGAYLQESMCERQNTPWLDIRISESKKKKLVIFCHMKFILKCTIWLYCVVLCANAILPHFSCELLIRSVSTLSQNEMFASKWFRSALINLVASDQTVTLQTKLTSGWVSI